MQMETAEKMVMVPVPQHLVVEVYRFIASREADKPEAASVEHDGSEPQQEEAWRYSYSWSEDDLRDTLENGTRAMKLILPHLARHADQEVPGQELADLVYGEGANMQQLGGALGSFTRTASKRYGRLKWPFKPIRPTEEEPFWKYIMYPDTAEKVLKLTSG
jgi:hypothetical protein